MKPPIVMQEVHGSAWIDHRPAILRALWDGRLTREQLASACGVDKNANAFVRALRQLTDAGKIVKHDAGRDARGRQRPVSYARATLVTQLLKGD